MVLLSKELRVLKGICYMNNAWFLPPALMQAATLQADFHEAQSVPDTCLASLKQAYTAASQMQT